MKKMTDTKRYIVLVAALAMAMCGYAQKTDRDFVRRGNKLYADSLYTKAEVEYRRALDVNPQSVEATYNLGNALLMQQKGEEALKMYQTAASLIPANNRGIALNEEEKIDLARIYHNTGVLLQSSKQLAPCIEAYKNALRNNPRDHETRYNLTLAMKQQQQEQQQDQQQQEQQQPQQPQEQQDMSKENAEQMLKAIMQDEKEIQEKVQKAMQEVQPRKFEKDW